MTYLLIRNVHIACAVLTACGFLLRGGWMLMESPLLQHRLAKVLPHIVDTVLLLSAIALAIMSRQYPFVLDWLTLKVLLLVAYILFGTFALKRGRSKKIRAVCFLAALCCLAAIFGSAILRPVFF